jgi:hypothetical protein
MVLLYFSNVILVWIILVLFVIKPLSSNNSHDWQWPWLVYIHGVPSFRRTRVCD